MSRLTNLDLAILRTSPGKSDTFIYTVPKVNKVKAYCKLGKLEDIIEHFKIESIEQLENILEAWEIVNSKITIEKGTIDYANISIKDWHHHLNKKEFEILEKVRGDKK